MKLTLAKGNRATRCDRIEGGNPMRATLSARATRAVIRATAVLFAFTLTMSLAQAAPPKAAPKKSTATAVTAASDVRDDAGAFAKARVGG